MISIIILIITASYLLIQFLNAVIVWLVEYDEPNNLLDEKHLPEIAILIAARNEEKNIKNCLENLVNLDYPVNRISILIGNDQSTDKTEIIAQSYANKFPHIKVIAIEKGTKRLKGKANVLAQLAKQTKASYLFITDADITVHRLWVKTLLSYVKPGTGIVSGLTVVSHEGFLGRMQQTDWLYFMGLLLSFARLKIPGTAVGNNMLVTREAYEDVGGYESIPFSVTEDYKLYKEVRKKGYITKNIFHPNATNISAPVSGFWKLINQRKRWLTGAMDLPYYWWFVFLVFSLFLPAVVVYWFQHPQIAILLYLFKFLIQSITIRIQQYQVNIRTSIFTLLWFEIYMNILTIVSALYFILPIRLRWKNRTY